MSLIIAAITIIFAGAVGGVFNSIILDKGFIKGGKISSNGQTIWKLGFSSNVLCGAFAAFVSWGLYGPLSSADLFQANNTAQLTLATLCGAALTGFSGASWLTTQVDKNIWRTTAIEATQAQPSSEAAAEISVRPPQEALNIIRNLQL